MSSTRRVLVVQHEDRVPLGRLDLGAVGVDVVRPDRGDPLPARLTDHDGLVVLGARVAAWQDDAAPWLPATRDLLARAVVDGAPVLGVCLGAQLLALATGGSVRRGAAGPETGVVEVTATPAAADDALVGGLGPAWLAAQSHRDAVTALPDGAVLLAGSATYPHQAFRLGDAAWGVQYHPEVTLDVLADWLSDQQDELASRGRTVEEVLAEADAAEPRLADLAVAHGRAFVRVVAGRAAA